ncbi:MAG: 3-deoxy-D-manno-octulosonic acid transferase [Lentisphaeria bacterium]|nr:3-deoxy-D-manno-octulosonic acid transferase [Lentisphaeria bacterium]
MALFLYNLVFPLLFVVYLPFYMIHLFKRGGMDRFFWERLGLYTREKKERLSRLSRPVWIHAVSVGEAVAATGFIRRWREERPDLDFVLSTTTTTGQAIARKNLPDGVVLIYCPLDIWCAVRRVLGLINPRLLMIFEVEYWPCLITQSVKRGTPVVLANGRMSDKSAAGYARHAWFFRPLFEKFSLFCMQSDADVRRIRQVVGDAVPAVACDTMKFDQVPDVAGTDRSDLLNHVFGSGEKLIWTVGSTHANEEALIADVYQMLKREFPALKVILVPRHHERTAEVEAELRKRDLTWTRLDNGSQEPAAGVDILLVNKTGELMSFYETADIVYVGKSLAGCEGGHNIIEPAIFGKPIAHGPNMQNFRLVVELFKQAGASIEVKNDDGLLPAMRDLCANPERRRELSEKSRRVVTASRGAMTRTLGHVKQILP